VDYSLNNLKIELSGNNQQVIKQITENAGTEKFFVKRKLSKRLFYILVASTRIKKIFLTNPVYKQISKKNISALKSMNIEVKIIKSERGRPKKFGRGTISKIKKIKKFKTAKMKFKISKRSFYNFKKSKSE